MKAGLEKRKRKICNNVKYGEKATAQLLSCVFFPMLFLLAKIVIGFFFLFLG